MYNMQGVERCLWDYKANLASQAAMREEIANLMSVRGHSYEAHVISVASDPVADVTNRILNLEHRIKNSEKRTRPVEKLRGDLQSSDMYISQMGKILSLRYIEHESIEVVMDKLAISSSTFWRRTKELLRTARKYFGQSE